MSKAIKCNNNLFLNEWLSDLTIFFQHHGVSFHAHRLMVARTSPYFENLFYGPMAIKEKEWIVRDIDITPENFKIVLAHCYDLDFPEENFEITLHVYKLADFYMINSLKSECINHIRNILSQDKVTLEWNYQYILEWSKKYGFNDIKFEVLKGLSIRLHKHQDISKLLVSVPLETRMRLLKLRKEIDVLSFKESWRNPAIQPSSAVLMTIFKSSNCNNELYALQGCFADPKVLNTILISEELYLSLIDEKHSQALYDCVSDKLASTKLMVYIHITCKSLSPKDLAIWSSMKHRNSEWKIDKLYLSIVDDEHVQWVVDTIKSINPYDLSLPRCYLSIDGFKTLITSLASHKHKLSDIDIRSTKIEVKLEEEINAWVKTNYGHCVIRLYNSDSDICGW